ncbi:HAD family hydrolase [Phaeobacter marinintestinus]|uniref:HAD family hydrolase n=1 Tax=Falsiphaeobacter marinintestinus TaxID=1492905 RepID=UPI0011B422EA|nr:HAD family phosphatase [Phaeobacter marinintestinus]
MTGLVIFDCDGVLVDSERATNLVLVEDLAGYGLTLTLEDCFRMFVGGTMLGVAAKARTLGADLPTDWVDQIYAKMYARLEEGVPLVPGVRNLLGYLENNDIPHCVASNGHEAKMQITLGQNGLWEQFQGRIFSAYTLGVSKPDPGLFLAAAEQFGVQPAECLVVEDSATGVTAAARAGMRCLGYAPLGDGAQLQALGATVILDMAEVPAHIL